MELGETVPQAVVREVMEELGIKVRIGRLFEVATDVELDQNGKVRYHFVIVDYIAQPSPGKIRLSHESSEFGWFTASEVKALDMASFTREVVLRVLEQAGHRHDSKSDLQSPR